jgi:uncharacterized protein
MMTKEFDRRALFGASAAAIAAWPKGGFAASLVKEDTWTPSEMLILSAAKRGNLSTIARLVNQGSSLGTKGEGNITFLQWALAVEHRRAFETLLRAGADASQIGRYDKTVIHNAAAVPQAYWLKKLLDHGADPNSLDNVTLSAPIFDALQAERVAQFTMLLTRGANVRLADRTGNTALHVAAQINEPWRALDLLRAGADPLARNAQNQTFQRYLFMTKSHLLNRQARDGMAAVRSWLNQNNIPSELNP